MARRASSLSASLIRVAQPEASNENAGLLDSVTGSIRIAFDDPTSSPARGLQQSLESLYASCASLPCRRERDALEQERDYWRHLATTDELTDLQNRRGLNLSLDEEQAHLNDGTSQGGVILFVDMDGFKSINDRFGHEWGDRCLKIVASVLDEIKGLVRDTDIVANNADNTATTARFGGDEFVMILRDTSQEKAQDRINLITHKLNSMHLFIANGSHIDLDAPEDTYVAKIRASVGVFEYTLGDDLRDVMKRADEAMYATKQARKAALSAAPASDTAPR